MDEHSGDATEADQRRRHGAHPPEHDGIGRHLRDDRPRLAGHPEDIDERAHSGAQIAPRDQRGAPELAHDDPRLSGARRERAGGTA